MRLKDAEALISLAGQKTGLSDFDGESWREGLDRLVEDMARQPLTEAGSERVENRIVNTLMARLRIKDWIARHPADAPRAKSPVVIMGLPRTATTALFAFMANDARWRYLREWEATEPVPPPDIATEATDPRRLREIEKMRGAGDIPRSQHIQEAGGPVDDAALLRLDFRNQELGWPAWNYTRWWRDCDLGTTYALHADVLGLLQSRRPPDRWLVKAPWHNFHLDDLIGAYPDATFIMCHRDPAKLVASVASLLRTSYQTVIPKSEIDLFALGNFVLEHLRISVERVMDFRRRHGDDRFIDVQHREFNADPFGVLGTIYDRLGIEPTEASRTGMRKWIERNRSGTHGEHRYSSEEFGLSRSMLEDAFTPYVQQFDIDTGDAAVA